MSAPTSETGKTRRDSMLKLLGYLITLLFGSGALWKACDYWKTIQPPTYAISAINTLTGENIYEVTNYLLWYPDVPASAMELNLGVEIRPTYAGKPLGEVRVLVKNEDGAVLARDGWASLDKDSKPIQLIFGPEALAAMVDGQLTPYAEREGSYIYPRASLLVEVSKVSDPGHPYTDTVEVLNTPWYHFTRAAPNFLGDARTLEVFVRGRNLGEPSGFLILTEAYEITDLAGRPFDPWPKLDWMVQEVGQVERGAEFSTSVTLPTGRFQLERGKCYAIKTFAIKKQNYVQFKGAGWADSIEAWRLGDWEDFAFVCLPAGQ